jgi:hypothetical protein
MSELARILAIGAFCLFVVIPVLGYVLIRFLELTAMPSESTPWKSDAPPHIEGATVTPINKHEAQVRLQDGRVYTFGKTREGRAYYTKPNGDTVYANGADYRFGKEPNAALMEHFRRYEAKR